MVKNILHQFPIENEDASEILICECLPKITGSSDDLSLNFKTIFCKSNKFEVCQSYEDSMLQNILDLDQFTLEKNKIKINS